MDLLRHMRSRIVMAASEAGIDAMDGPFFDPTDIDGLVAETKIVAGMGFTGKASYDAVQIPHIHNIFTPSPNDIDHALRSSPSQKVKPVKRASTAPRSIAPI